MILTKHRLFVTSLILLLLGVSSIIVFKNESFADKMFYYFHLDPWSNGNSGFHYSNFTCLIFMVPIFLITRNHMDYKPLKFIRHVALLLLLVITLSSLAYFINLF